VRLDIRGTPGWMWLIAAVFVVARTIGKMAGARLGARLSGAADGVRRYLGYTLFSQAGVAIGLAILASVRFGNEYGTYILTTVTATTFLVQIIGPPFVKYAIQKAGEAGRDVTEADLMRALTAGEAMTVDVPDINVRAPMRDALTRIAESDAPAFPVHDDDGHLVGIITTTGLKQSLLLDRDAAWYLAYDFMEEAPDPVTASTPLAEAVTRMREQHIEFLPVVSSDEARKFEGLLDLQVVSRRLSRDLIQRRGEGDAADESPSAV
jgi:CBS domain-containing protein